jgi:lysozyme
MTDNDALLLAELQHDEGIRLAPYRCTAGKLTIGIGRNLDDRGITVDEAIYLARNDIEACKRELDKALSWWRKLDPVRQRVLLNMAFNLGIPKLLKFRNTLAAVDRGQWDKAADGMMNSAWAVQTGQRAVRLAYMMRTGERAGGYRA